MRAWTQKVLVIAGGPITAFVNALAAMRQIRLAHPKARITLLTTRPFEGLAGSCPYVDDVDPGGAPEDFRDWRALVGRLRAARHDRVYDLDCTAATNLMFQLLRPFPPAWSGEASGCALPFRAKPNLHALERHATQLEAAGIWPDAPINAGAAPPPDARWIARRIVEPRSPQRPHVLFFPGPAAAPPDRRWPIDRFADLSQRLRGQGFDVLVVGETEDAALARAIQHRGLARDLTGRIDYARVAALAARAMCVIGNDFSLMHLTAAAGAPTLALAPGSVDPARLAPRGHVTILQAQSLAELSVETVIEALRRLAPPMPETV